MQLNIAVSSRTLPVRFVTTWTAVHKDFTRNYDNEFFI